MWYKDTPGHQDKRTTDNKGFIVPESIDGSKQVCTDDEKTTLGFILSREVFTESRRSENQITTKSRRVRSNGRCDNYKIIIKDLALFVRNVQLSPAVRMCHVKALEKTSCKYPIDV